MKFVTKLFKWTRQLDLNQPITVERAYDADDSTSHLDIAVQCLFENATQGETSHWVG